jgi:YggT family protein
MIRLFSSRPQAAIRQVLGESPQVMNPFKWLLLELIWLYIAVVIAAVVFSWLVAFNVVNTRNQFVASVGRFLYLATEPVFGRIRRYLPSMGGLDLSPMIVLIGLLFLYRLVDYYVP